MFKKISRFSFCLLTIQHYHVILLLKVPPKASQQRRKKTRVPFSDSQPCVAPSADFSQLILYHTPHSAPAPLASSRYFKSHQAISCWPLQYKIQNLSLNPLRPASLTTKSKVVHHDVPLSHQPIFSLLPFLIDVFLMSMSL